MNVLLSAAYGPAAQCVIKGLKEQNKPPINIITVDANKDSVDFGKKQGYTTIQSPPVSDARYIDFILGIIQNYNISLFIPILDQELEKVACSRTKFLSYGCSVFIADHKMVKIAHNKKLAYDYCQQKNIPFPKTYILENLSNTEFEFPLFIKPSIGTGAKHSYKIDSLEELEFWLKRVPNPIVQEYVQGEEYTIDMLMDNSSIIGIVPRIRLDTKLGISIKGKTMKNKDLMNFAADVAIKFKVLGPCNIQCFKTDKGKILFSEINMRPAGTSVLSIKAGFNFPLLMAKMAAGYKIDPMLGCFKDKLFMLRHWEESFFEEG